MGANDITRIDKFSKEIKRCEETGKSVCSSDIQMGTKTGRVYKTKKIPAYDYKEHLTRNFIPDRSMIRVSLLKKYLPFKTKYYNCGFWDLWLRIYEGEGDVFCRTQEVGWTYLQHEESMHIKRQKDKKIESIYLSDIAKMLKTHGKG